MATILDPDTLAPLEAHDLEYGQRVIVEEPALDGHGTTFHEASVTTITGEHVGLEVIVYAQPEPMPAYVYRGPRP